MNYHCLKIFFFFLTPQLHAANIPIMNMCGLPHHAQKAIDAGIDIICAQGTEAGGLIVKTIDLND